MLLEEAGRYLKMAESVVDDGSPDLHAKMLGKLDVVREDSSGAGIQVLVMLGSQEQPLQPPAIDVLMVPHPPAA